MKKLGKERTIGLFGLAVWVVSAFACIFTKYSIVIVLSLVYSLWFGSYVNDLGRKGMKEAGLI